MKKRKGRKAGGGSGPKRAPKLVLEKDALTRGDGRTFTFYTFSRKGKS